MTLSDHLKILELTSNNEVIFISFNSGSFSIQFFGFLKIGLGPGMFPLNPFFLNSDTLRMTSTVIFWQFLQQIHFMSHVRPCQSLSDTVRHCQAMIGLIGPIRLYQVLLGLRSRYTPTLCSYHTIWPNWAHPCPKIGSSTSRSILKIFNFHHQIYHSVI